QVTAQRPKFDRAVEPIRDAAAHPGREVPARRTENDHASAGHVLTAMISDTLDHGSRPAISNGKTLAGLTANIYLSARRPVERDVSDDDVLVRRVRGTFRRLDDQLRTGESLPEIVVRVPPQIHGDSARAEREEALTRRAAKIDADAVLREALRAVAVAYLRRQHRADRAVRVANRCIHFDRRGAIERGLRPCD